MTAHAPPDPTAIVQRQLDAYNARDLRAFVACYAPAVQVYRPPAAQPALAGRQALSDHYAAKRFNLPALRAELLGRIVVGHKVIDHERVFGVNEQPFEAAVVYEVDAQGLIAAVWFFNAD
jgi:hypothetical protein